MCVIQGFLLECPFSVVEKTIHKIYAITCNEVGLSVLIQQQININTVYLNICSSSAFSSRLCILSPEMKYYHYSMIYLDVY